MTTQILAAFAIGFIFGAVLFIGLMLETRR
jgi:hypothetical protein